MSVAPSSGDGGGAVGGQGGGVTPEASQLNRALDQYQREQGQGRAGRKRKRGVDVLEEDLSEPERDQSKKPRLSDNTRSGEQNLLVSAEKGNLVEASDEGAQSVLPKLDTEEDNEPSVGRVGGEGAQSLGESDLEDCLSTEEGLLDDITNEDRKKWAEHLAGYPDLTEGAKRTILKSFLSDVSNSVLLFAIRNC